MIAESAVSRADIEAARERIQPHVRHTPLMETASLRPGGAPVSLKLELLQHSGSFKARGAFNNLLQREAPPVGCATASGGNHGAAVAFAAHRLGVKAKIFVPSIASPAKIAKIRAYGADVHVEGQDYFDAQALCDAYVAQSGALKIHPYDAAETIAGQGTVALEWEQDLARLGLAALDTVLIAVGGGGLISGVAAAFEGRVRVIGVEPMGSRAMDAALRAGGPVEVPIQSIAADSLGARQIGALPYAICRSRLERVVLVEDADIVAAQRLLWRDCSLIAEPGGAAAFAAWLGGAYAPAPSERVGVLIHRAGCGAARWPLWSARFRTRESNAGSWGVAKW
jgi:threonine dehydratase